MFAHRNRIWTCAAWALLGCVLLAGAPMKAAETSAAVGELLTQRTNLYETFRKFEHFQKQDEATTVAQELAAVERKLVAAIAAEQPPVPQRVRAMQLALVQTLEWLAKRLEAKQQLAGAEQVRREALQVLVLVYGDDDWRTVDARIGLENLQQLRKLLSERPDDLKRAGELVKVVTELSDGDRAFEALNKANELLALRRDLLGETHPDVILLMSEIGYLYFRIGNLAEAERVSLDALRQWEKLLGKRHPQFASSLANLGMFYMQMGQSGAAIDLFQKAAEVYRTTLGDHDPRYAASLITLADLYQSLGQTPLAEPHYRAAVDIYSTALGESHREYLTALCNHGLLLAELDRFDESEPLVSRALELRRLHLGADHADTIQNLFNLGEVQRLRGKRAQAAAAYKQAAQQWRDAIGERDPTYAMMLERLIEFYASAGEIEQATTYRDELERVRSLPPQPDSSNKPAQPAK